MMPEHSPELVAFISAGSSIEPEKHLAAALSMLAKHLHVLAISTVYRTPAIDRPGDPDFLNCVFQVSTAIPPRALKCDVLRGIEEKLGRERLLDKYAPRTIDLDLILYGDEVADGPDLKLPHADLSRWFVRVPILELSPELELPGLGRKLRDIGTVDEVLDEGVALPELTDLLRRRFTQ
jgi:2-amino-4-hydroxy-6-hydroxymethyldihydropteridine diphosphokinase